MIKNEYYSEQDHGPHEYLELGDFELIQGGSIPNAKLAYKTHGKLNAAKDNAILFPHMYSGTPKSMEGFIGEGSPLGSQQILHHLAGAVWRRILVVAE